MYSLAVLVKALAKIMILFNFGNYRFYHYRFTFHCLIKANPTLIETSNAWSFNSTWEPTSFNSLCKTTIKTKKALSLCAIDLKRFKQINDQIGYQVGDQVLVEFANQLSLLKDCHAFRLGGDEFVLVGTYSGAQANLAHWIKNSNLNLNLIINRTITSFRS